MAKTPRTALAVLLATAGLLALPGCGNKGALVRPPVIAEDAPPPDELPPATEPSEADPPAEIQPPPAADPPSDPTPTPVSDDGDG